MASWTHAKRLPIWPLRWCVIIFYSHFWPLLNNIHIFKRLLCDTLVPHSLFKDSTLLAVCKTDGWKILVYNEWYMCKCGISGNSSMRHQSLCALGINEEHTLSNSLSAVTLLPYISPCLPSPAVSFHVNLSGSNDMRAISASTPNTSRLDTFSLLIRKFPTIA